MTTSVQPSDSRPTLAEELLKQAMATEDEGFDLPDSSSNLPRWHGRQSDLAPALPRPDARPC